VRTCLTGRQACNGERDPSPGSWAGRGARPNFLEEDPFDFC